MNAILIAATGSGCGKTTITAGLMRALSENKTVLPFKCGPDYIDPMFHEKACGKPSYNLDACICSDDTVRQLFYSKLSGEDNAFAVVEGVMGLYDGLGKIGKGSAADLSKILGIPVILIVDGRGMSRSISAVVKGFAELDPDVHIAGVIINRIRSQALYELLAEMILEDTGIACVGWFEENAAIHLDSRHLGLIPAEELTELDQQLDLAAQSIKNTVDMAKISALSKLSPSKHLSPDPFTKLTGAFSDLTIGIARDRAFNFYYGDNLLALKQLGVSLVPFSPITDSKLPENLDAVYIGGGFPEVFAKELEANAAFRHDLREKLEAGLACYAECGGQIYLTQEIITKEGSFAGVGFIPGKTEMTDRLQHFGYCHVAVSKSRTADNSSRENFAELNWDETNRDANTRIENNSSNTAYQLTAHEFHHSKLQTKEALNEIYTVSKKNTSWRGGIRIKNTLTGYPHLHFYAQDDGPELLLSMLTFVREKKSNG